MCEDSTEEDAEEFGENESSSVAAIAGQVKINALLFQQHKSFALYEDSYLTENSSNQFLKITICIGLLLKKPSKHFGKAWICDIQIIQKINIALMSNPESSNTVWKDNFSFSS